LWGPGTSLGHSDAVRKIDGVKDAISITLPLKTSANLHKRVVFVVCEKQNKKQIKNQVLNMPNYFAGQNVKVYFVSQRRFDKIKHFSHAGQVVCDTPADHLKFECKMQSNPMFTAKIVVGFVGVFTSLKNKYGNGAFVPLDFSPTDLTGMTRIDAIKKFC